MINSVVMQKLRPLVEIIEQSIGKTIGEIKDELNIARERMVKGASGLIVENMLGIVNNNIDEPDIPEIGCEVKALPIQINRDGTVKAKEPTAIQMINYCDVAKESWENAKIRRKIKLTLWVVYLAKHGSARLHQNDYVIVDYLIEQPCDITVGIFRKDWETVRDCIIAGNADRLSCRMGTYIEPKTKGKNRLDVTSAPDGCGGLTTARRRAFYYKKNYTNSEIIPQIDLSAIYNKYSG